MHTPMTAAEYSTAIAKVLVEIRQFTPADRNFWREAVLLRFEFESVMAVIRDAGVTGIARTALIERLAMNHWFRSDKLDNVLSVLTRGELGPDAPKYPNGDPVPYVHSCSRDMQPVDGGVEWFYSMERAMPHRTLRTELLMRHMVGIPDYMVNNGFQWIDDGEETK